MTAFAATLSPAGISLDAIRRIALPRGLPGAAVCAAGLCALALLAFGGTAPQAPAAAPAAVRPPAVTMGVVDSIHELAPHAGSGARRFEMTIRLRDGSMRVSQETGGARWRAGDPVHLIGSQADR